MSYFVAVLGKNERNFFLDRTQSVMVDRKSSNDLRVRVDGVSVPPTAI